MIQHEFDKKRNPYKGTLYFSGVTHSGNGLYNKSTGPFYESDSDSDEHEGGFIDFGSLISNVGSFIADNKDFVFGLNRFKKVSFLALKMIQHEFDKKRNPYKGTIFFSGVTHSGNGLYNKSTGPFYESDSDSDDDQNGRSHEGGFIDFGSLISNVGSFISNNKDTIQAVASTAGKVADAGKAISETVKAAHTKNNNKKTLTPEDENRMFGAGFKVFKK
jgi:hypothetical protein